MGPKFNEPVALSNFNQKTQQTGSEIGIMNLKTLKICAERTEKMQNLVYFEQISLSKIQNKTNFCKIQVSWKRNSSALEKKTQAFWLQNSTNW